MLAIEPVTVGFLVVEPPHASISAQALNEANKPNVFDKNECFIFPTRSKIVEQRTVEEHYDVVPFETPYGNSQHSIPELY